MYYLGVHDGSRPNVTPGLPVQRHALTCHPQKFDRPSILISVIGDLLCRPGLSFRSTKSIEAEHLFLRRQLALYVERGIKRRRIDPVTRIPLAFLSRFCNWRDALVVVRPETMIRWHQMGWRLRRLAE